MSLDTWKAEFYPVPADKVPEDQAAAHSLRKWIGLRQENLDRHGLKTPDLYVDNMGHDLVVYWPEVEVSQ